MVDEAGYLQGDLDDLADKLGAPQSLVDKVLGELQGFDPPGVFARDLAECLALQLKDQNRYDPQIAKLLDNLALLGSHNLAALKRAVGVDAEELAEMIAEIKRLNPKPGLQFGSVQIQPVLPDVLVRPAPRRQLAGRAQQRHAAARAGQPQLLHHRLQDHALRPGQAATCSTACRTPTGWSRASTSGRAPSCAWPRRSCASRTASSRYGIEHLKPLNLKTVADAISMHESTVSRVTSNKYMSTPRGMFELKYFFTSAIASADGGGRRTPPKPCATASAS